MSEFGGDLIAMDLPDGRKRLVLFDFMFLDNAGMIWVTFRGVVYDGATIPRFAWSIIGGPYEGKYRRAAAIHDPDYTFQYRMRLMGDRMLREGAIADGTGVCKAQIMESCVRQFGQHAWDDLDQGDYRPDLVPAYINAVPSDSGIPEMYKTAVAKVKAEMLANWTELMIKAAQR
jgi:hypothetical protein